MLKNKSRGAYLTVYLSLTLAVMLSLCLALIEGVRQNAVFLEAECVTDIGLNSILAEYHRELLKQYNLFAIDSSYGSNRPETAETARHLASYMQKNFSCDDIFLEGLLYRDFLKMSPQDVKLTKVSLLTDDKGKVFRRRAAEAVWDDMNLNLYQEVKGWMQVVESNKLTTRDVESEKSSLDGELNGYNGQEKQISETEWTTVSVDNPTDAVERGRSAGILNMVVENPESISTRTIQQNNLIGARMSSGKANKGNMKMEKRSSGQEALEGFFFHEYLLRYMGHYGAEVSEDALKYQIEYLIAGSNSDMENMKSVAGRLCAIREVSNVIYIFSDSEKCKEAGAVADVLAAVMLIPEAAEVIKGIILFGWAFAESIYDVKCLLAGKKIPLMKSKNTWHYSLETALKMDTSMSGAQGKGSGLAYKDYLRILLMLTDENTLTARAMDMVEADLRQTPGNKAFRLDGCIDALEACVHVQSAYGYDCEITRKKAYSTQ